MPKVITLKCSTCDKDFELQKTQYDYQVKAGRAFFYCSRGCVGKRAGNIDRLKTVSVEHRFRSDSPRYTALKTEEQILKSSMKDFIRRFRDRCKTKSKKLGQVDISVDDLVSVWMEQDGLCYFTKVRLILPRDCSYKGISSNYKASVDRIDNSIGYVKGNIRFVSHTVNNMRNAMDDAEVMEFFKILKEVVA